LIACLAGNTFLSGEMSDKKRERDHTRTIEFKAMRGSEPSMKKKAFLTVIRGAGSDLGQHVVVGERLTLGRGPDCGLTLQDLGISWEHAEISKNPDGGFVICDMGSTNGTMINGVRIEGSHDLCEGEKIFLGECVLRFALADEMDLGFHNEVQQLVGTDPLTGLESKRVFDDALDYSLQVARREGKPLAVLMMDMDGIKKINDTHGHLFGAYAIGETGKILDRVIGKAGHVCRFGGDEFTAFLPACDKQAALELAGRILKAVREAGLEKDSIPLRPTISIGVAAFPEDGDHVLDLVATADGALYRAKASGRDKVSI